MMTMKAAWLHFGIIVCIAAGVWAAGSNEATTMITNCCAAGEEIADRTANCTHFQPPANVSQESISSCFFASEICCSAKLRIESCKAGVMAGKEGLDCTSNSSEFYTGCCEACKIGLVNGASDNECPLDPFMFGAPFDDSYMYCCRELKATETFYIPADEEPNFCKRFERLCSQLCVNTDDSYVCQCEAGFHLHEDKITCIKDDDVNNSLTDEFASSSQEDCPTGHTLNAERGECEDINECESDEATCDIDTQVCFNTVGSYKCLDILTDERQSPVGSAAASRAHDCDTGLRYNTKTDECDDINECLEQTDTCDRHAQLCLNTHASFQCQQRMRETCLSGFAYDERLKNCQDINECEGGSKVCAFNTVCENTRGGFNCLPVQVTTKRPVSNPLLLARERVTCAIGYSRQFDKCVDIDECYVDRRACSSNQNCINTPGSFRCDCKIGFKQDSITNACVDINECQINNHDCLETQRCDNTIGSYACIRLQSCGTGYTLNAGTGQCEDDDECVLNYHNCLKPYECRNTKGSFRCEKPRTTTTTTTTTTTSTTTTTTTPRPTPAPQPYRTRPPYHPSSSSEAYLVAGRASCATGTERDALGACVDIDECVTQYPCRRGQRCVNTNGSYRCENLLTCSGGYEPNAPGTQCVDIDECATGQANCSPGQNCHNKPGGYTCTCPSGYVYRQQRCEDIDECSFYRGQVCPTNADCRNTPGAFSCECHRGFRKQRPDDKVCTDVDECREQPRLCSQQCVNMWGSHRCTCDSGYELAADNRTCTDIDECVVHKSYNLCMGRCDNTAGSFRCSCPDGYHMGADGRSCVDINECDSRHTCAPGDICSNLRGGHRCTSIQCPPDFMRDPEKPNRCKRMSLMCAHNDMECYGRPMSYVYNFIVLTANMTVPPQGRALFTLSGPSYYEQLDFNFKIMNRVTRLAQHVDERFFRLETLRNECNLHLLKTLQGPQDVELQLQMTAYRNGQLAGSNVQMILLIVSENEY